YAGGTNTLAPGDKLRYTITVKNVSNAGVANVMLRDAIPANTTYFASSTTLNGTPLADVSGMSPLVNGALIHSPSDPTPGSMPADPSNSQANVATITFTVVVNPNTPNGALICNQGFVSSSGSGLANQPSDDPRTSTPGDATCDVVGNHPVLY